MRYQVNLEGFSGHRVEVELPGLLRGSRVLVDGQPAPKGSKRGQYLLRGGDGRDSTVELKTTFLDPVPQVLWAGKKIALAEPLQWYQWIWSGIPILLLFMGGAIGGFVGAIGVTMNIHILRSEMTGVLRYVSTAFISIGAFVTYAVLAQIVLTAIRGH